MTDNEIIKVLEYCFTRGFDESTCYECPFYTATAKCTEDLRDSALDLINRQKAEIEEWKKKANTPFAKVTFDRDKLQEIVDECAKNIEIDINLAKSEAIKEFAHLVIDRSRNGVICVSDVPDLVKEITEGR